MPLNRKYERLKRKLKPAGEADRGFTLHWSLVRLHSGRETSTAGSGGSVRWGVSPLTKSTGSDQEPSIILQFQIKKFYTHNTHKKIFGIVMKFLPRARTRVVVKKT